MIDKPRLCIVVPCYNEEEVLPYSAKEFKNKILQLSEMNLISKNSYVLFVDDGSSDDTWRIISEYSNSDKIFKGISLSRNRGHQNALLAGLMEAKDACDITISIDCDGQDDINAMDEMIKEYKNGCEIVYGVRSNRDSDTWLKRSTAQGFYKFLNMMGAETIYNHADYRLVSARALDSFSKYEEVNLFLRGMFPLVGYKSTAVYYKRNERIAGKTHYPLSKMIMLAVDGITSLSIKPIRIITMLGFITSILGFLSVIWIIIGALRGQTIDGWASTTCFVLILGGIQLTALGVIGEYVGKTYMETKHRPRYFVSERIGTDNNNDIKSITNEDE